MPCNGVTVLQAQLEAQANLVDLIVTTIGQQNIKLQSRDRDGAVKIAALIAGTQCQISIGRDGALTVVTRNGTFQSGKDALLGWIASLQGRGVKVSGVQFEQHRHDHHAPRLAYSTAQQK